MRDEYNFTGHDLIEMGFKPGPHFGKVLDIINAGTFTDQEIRDIVTSHEPAPALELLETPVPCVYNITTDTEFERENLEAVKADMEKLRYIPIAVEAAVMPDACPAGTIPVGGVLATRNAIAPGLHSADICCSLQATIFEDADPKAVLDAAHQATHFGPGGRSRDAEYTLDVTLREAMMNNSFLKNGKIRTMASSHLGTQGDGNHFLYVGRLESTGQTVMITHHGSRGVGAFLYKLGMKEAEKFRKKLSPKTPKGAAWIPSKSKEGRDYWEALQLVREWTRLNHTVIHDATAQALGAKIAHRRWNEHNFVFREEVGEDEIFWHAKGATPIHNPHLPDTDGIQIVPLNMREPILFVKSERNERNRGFAPHGAGRNMSRTKHKALIGDRCHEEVFIEETQGLDARFFSGRIDVSELPSAYKNAESVQRDMKSFNLANVFDRVLPYGCIMAGDWEQDAPWKKKAAEKAAARAATSSK